MAAQNTDDRIRYEVSGGIACIGLARPPVNALDLAMVRGVIAALNRAAADNDARAVVIASAVAKRFCAGLDIAELAGRSPDHRRAMCARQGFSRGGQRRRAWRRDDARCLVRRRFGRPQRHVRLSGDRSRRPAGHSLRASAAHYRPPPAFELLFTGRPFDATQAAALGLVNRVVPDAELETKALKLAGAFAAKPEAAMRAGRAAFMRQIDRDYRRRIAEAVEDFCAIVATEAAQARLRAFAERGRTNDLRSP